MTMNYLRPADKRPKRATKFVIVVVFLVLIAFFFSGAIGSLGKNFLNSLGFPVWKAGLASSEKFYFLGSFFNSRIKQAEEIRILKDELLLANLNLKEFESMVEENRNLKALLNREDNQEAISASVLVRPPQSLYDIFIIDIGRRHGLVGGEKVFVENVLLGFVDEVFNKTSKVKIVSSPGFEISAFIERVNLPVVVVGRGGGNFQASLPQEVEVEVGDFLVVPGLPQKLLGQIEEVEQTETGSFKKILFRLPVNLSEIRWVAVEIGAD